MSPRDRGSLSMEFVLMLPVLACAVLFIWQLLLTGLVAISAENAARAGSREASLSTSADGETTAIEALSSTFSDGAEATADGTHMTVTVPVPVVLPGITNLPGTPDPAWTITRTAEFPKD